MIYSRRYFIAPRSETDARESVVERVYARGVPVGTYLYYILIITYYVETYRKRVFKIRRAVYYYRLSLLFLAKTISPVVSYTHRARARARRS